jgi:hypothetical protein
MVTLSRLLLIRACIRCGLPGQGLAAAAGTTPSLGMALIGQVSI